MMLPDRSADPNMVSQNKPGSLVTNLVKYNSKVVIQTDLRKKVITNAYRLDGECSQKFGLKSYQIFTVQSVVSGLSNMLHVHKCYFGICHHLSLIVDAVNVVCRKCCPRASTNPKPLHENITLHGEACVRGHSLHVSNLPPQ